MQVQMKYHLPPTPFHVIQQLIAGSGNAVRFCHVFGHHNQFRQDPLILIGEIVDAADMFFGHEQQVNRRMRIDVFKYHQGVGFKQNFGLRMTMGDLTERICNLNGIFGLCQANAI